MFSPLFSPAVVKQVPVSQAGLAAAIQAYQKDLQTGLVEVNLADHPRLDLLFAHGQVVNAYERGDTIRRISPQVLPEHFSALSGDGFLRGLALTPQAIRLAKILLEQMGSQQPAEIQTTALEAQFETWAAAADPGLAHVCWPGAEALALLPGGANPARNTLFIAADQILHSAGGMLALFGWKEEQCTAALYSSTSQTPAWKEYLLHSSFVWMTGHLLAHFEELAGRLLHDAVVHETNFTAAARGWNISLAPRSVTDQMIFGSIEDAAKVYRELFELILSHIESTLGPEMLKPLVQESLMRMGPAYRRVFHDYFGFSEPAGIWPVNVDQSA